jgi:site-specific DNA-cytosine methylase
MYDPASPSNIYRDTACFHVPKKRRVQASLRDLWGHDTLRDTIVCTPAETVQSITHPCDEEQLLVVDLFCGCGGFSTGAGLAGARVVLAVDCDRSALAYHRVNHRGCKHVNMVLGPRTEARLVELIRSVVPEGRRWHLHGSPPCQLFSPMRNITKGKKPLSGMQLVEWYVDFARRVSPTTWTFENVRAPEIKELFVRTNISHGYFNFVNYGVPQTRKRCLAGSTHIIREFQSDPSLRTHPQLSPIDVLSPPPQATFIRASGGKCTESFYRSLSEPTWSLLCACKPVYVSKERSCVRVMHIQELLTLQTFPSSYRMKSRGHLSLLGTEADRVRLVGNAVPPRIAEMLVSIASRFE